jgi:formate-dependent nitrite reductase cytochrome c552 subunit
VVSDECNQKLVQADRFSQHTLICSSCNRTYQATNLLKQTFVGVAIGMAVFAIITDSFWNQIGAVSASLLAVALAVVAEKVKTNFERSYTRP